MTRSRPAAAGPSPSPAATVYVAVFSIRTDALLGERMIARLSADGAVDLLDGLVLDWPPDDPVTGWRPLENVPRLAALRPAVWTATLASPTYVPGLSLLPAGSGPRPGQAAVVAICRGAGRVEDLRGGLERLGATVHCAEISGEHYGHLRNAGS